MTYLDPMEIRLFKYPDLPHYAWPVTALGEDTEGRWFGAPARTQWTRGEHTGSFQADLLCLVPRDKWWLAELTREPAGVRLYVHVCTPPSVGETIISTVDLDLDVEMWPGEPAKLLDEEEFVENSVLLGYPSDLMGQARASADEWMRRLAEPGSLIDLAATWYRVFDLAAIKKKAP